MGSCLRLEEKQLPSCRHQGRALRTIGGVASARAANAIRGAGGYAVRGDAHQGVGSLVIDAAQTLAASAGGVAERQSLVEDVGSGPGLRRLGVDGDAPGGAWHPSRGAGREVYHAVGSLRSGQLGKTEECRDRPARLEHGSQE